MFIPDNFLIKDLLKFFRKTKVAFFIDDVKPYCSALASVRIRCYDVINYMEQKGIHAELYKPLKHYDIVIFTKTCSNKSVRMAHKLKQRGVAIYYEGYSEYLEDDTVQNQEKKNILEMIKMADIVGVSSDVQKATFSKFHSHVLMIPESVSNDFYKHQKRHEQKEKMTLVYCGYSVKARDTLCIKKVLQRIQKERSCEILYICDKDPQIEDVEYRYINYDQNIIPRQLMEGDIMIAPRPMENIDAGVHSFTKAAYPLSVGLPVVASPMPSYRNTPVILCNTDEEWYRVLNELLDDAQKRQEIGNKGREYIIKNFSMDVIGRQYLDIVEELGTRQIKKGN